uniref:Uncharacterized protein n=1 Tax=Zea mays TaxID=4577 RepID=A0A804MA89_MAIZE
MERHQRRSDGCAHGGGEEEVQDSRYAYSADEQSKPPEPLAVASVWSPPQTHAEAKGLRSLRPGVCGGGGRAEEAQRLQPSGGHGERERREVDGEVDLRQQQRAVEEQQRTPSAIQAFAADRYAFEALQDEDTAELTNYQHKNEVINSSERLTYGGHEDCNAYCLYATKKYKKGEQVLAYGTYTNMKLLERYSIICVWIVLI